MTQAEPEDFISHEEDAVQTPDEAAPSPDALLLGRIAALEEELAKAKDTGLRALADAENTRKRALRDREDAGKYAVAAFARDILDFADNFHRALNAIPAELKAADERVGNVITGIEAMEKDIGRTLEKHGITKIEPLGANFDANFHEVIFETPIPGKAGGVIIQVIEPGYMLRDRLLRPARVGVAKGEAEEKHKVDTTA